LATKVITTVAPGAGFRTSIQISNKELKRFLESSAGAQGLDGMRVRVTAELLEPESSSGADGSTIAGLGGRSIGGTGLLRTTAEDEVELPVAIEGSGGSGGGIRVVSDVDDTIKWTEVLKGTKTIFRNVFVRELDDIRVPGMASW
jgi:phosphatidate phosphatase APP1